LTPQGRHRPLLGRAARNRTPGRGSFGLPVSLEIVRVAPRRLICAAGDVHGVDEHKEIDAVFRRAANSVGAAALQLPFVPWCQRLVPGWWTTESGSDPAPLPSHDHVHVESQNGLIAAIAHFSRTAKLFRYAFVRNRQKGPGEVDRDNLQGRIWLVHKIDAVGDPVDPRTWVLPASPTG
jgi:hypothetical protein